MEGSLRRRRTGLNVMWMELARSTVQSRVAGDSFEDSSGSWQSGFIKGLGAMDSVSTEVWSLLAGLSFAWNEGYRRVWVESDSVNAVDMCRKGVTNDHSLASVVRQIKEFMSRNWELKLRWCFREENEAANWLAAEACNRRSKWRTLEVLPEDLRPTLEKDSGSGSRRRWIHLGD